jgi:hypothetical protein
VRISLRSRGQPEPTKAYGEPPPAWQRSLAARMSSVQTGSVRMTLPLLVSEAEGLSWTAMETRLRLQAAKAPRTLSGLTQQCPEPPNPDTPFMSVETMGEGDVRIRR